MKGLRILCAILAAINLGLFGALSIQQQPNSFHIVVSAKTRERGELAKSGRPVPFLSFSEYAAMATDDAVPVEQVPAEVNLDTTSMTYLGQMAGTDGKTVYFIKDRKTNRVYSVGSGAGQVKLLSADGSDLVVEINGAKYQISR